MIEPPTFESQLLTPERFKWVLDIGESTELAWREEKAVAFFRRGRVVRYTPEAVLEFITRHTVRARTVGTSNIEHRTSNIEMDWQRIERLIADQVRARLEFEQERRKAA